MVRPPARPPRRCCVPARSAILSASPQGQFLVLNMDKEMMQGWCSDELGMKAQFSTTLTNGLEEWCARNL